MLDAIEDGKLYVGPRIVRCFCMVWRIRRNDRLTDSYLDFLNADYLTVAKLSIGHLQYQRTSDVWSANRIECNHVYPILDCSSSNSNWMDSYLSWPSRPVSQQVTWVVPPFFIVILSNRSGLAGTDRNISMYGRDFLDLGTILSLQTNNLPQANNNKMNVRSGTKFRSS